VLVLANTVVSGPVFPATERKATYVFNKSASDIWLCSIDNSYGHEIIGKNAYKSQLHRICSLRSLSCEPGRWSDAVRLQPEPPSGTIRFT
jgi:hypothetical protein